LFIILNYVLAWASARTEVK